MHLQSLVEVTVWASIRGEDAPSRDRREGLEGLWVRRQLLEVGSTYVYSLYKSRRTFCDQAEALRVTIKLVTINTSELISTY